MGFFIVFYHVFTLQYHIVYDLIHSYSILFYINIVNVFECLESSSNVEYLSLSNCGAVPFSR